MINSTKVSFSENEVINITEDLSFNLYGQYVLNKGEKSFLTLIENQLLLFFINNYNRRIFIDEIIDYMQDRSLCYSEQNLYVYISRLRKKIEEDTKNPQILVNMRPGYIFCC
ncbi:helix-turn-helix domain-containing protein [Paenibacillus sp. Y412MC10]|uniref:winged helix-turn-helix domain-containing protein n=1 Tax=Geobacillus sp. (strain Y412MC10) TaxID=481743 RepID=UPI00164338A6